jgi:hypothetical protein
MARGKIPPKDPSRSPRENARSAFRSPPPPLLLSGINAPNSVETEVRLKQKTGVASRLIRRSVTFSPEMMENLREIAAIEKRDVTYIVQVSVADYIKRWVIDNPLKITLLIGD